MLAPRRAASIAIELPVGVQIVRFQIAVNGLAPWPRCAPTRRRLDDDERRLILLRNLGGRQARLLQGS